MPVAGEGGPWRVATRRSALARAQAATVAEALEAATGRAAELVPLATTGDDHPERALEAFDTKGLFVDGVRRAVVDGDCHLAVHSYKDLPTEPAAGLVIGAVPARVDPRDALVTREGLRLDQLPRDRALTVGTSSARRAAQLLHHRPALDVRPLRGNLDTRLRKVADGVLDAVVVAAAGLVRSKPDVGGVAAVPLDHGELLHAPAQGALALECRDGDEPTLAALAALDDPATRAQVAAERALLAALEGGCTAPIGAHAELDGDPVGGRLVLLGMLADPDGRQLYRASHEAAASQPELLARTMADTLRDAGGAGLAARARVRP